MDLFRSRGGPGRVWGRPGEGSPGGSSRGVEKGTPGERPGPFFQFFLFFLDFCYFVGFSYIKLTF